MVQRACLLVLLAATTGCEVLVGSSGSDAGTALDASAVDGGADPGSPDGSTGVCGDHQVNSDEECDIGIAEGQPGACPTSCTSGDNCVSATLTGTFCQTKCVFAPITECGPDDQCCPSGCTYAADHNCPMPKRVFVTSETYTASLYDGTLPTGLDNADQICNSVAHGAGIGGTWKAWLSDPTTNAIDRIADVGPWHLPGTWAEVFANKAALLGAAAVPIDRDQLGNPVTVTFAWTGTKTGGTYAGNACGGWTSTQYTDVGFVGKPSNADQWTHYGTLTCDNAARLYCFEQ